MASDNDDVKDDDDDDGDANSKDVEVVETGTGETLTILDRLVNLNNTYQRKKGTLLSP